MTTDTRITLKDVRTPSLGEIQEAETLHVGQYANLKIEEYQDVPGGMIFVRYWLNRTTPEDGETHRVDVEARTCPNGTWQDVGKLHPYSRHHARYLWWARITFTDGRTISARLRSVP